MLLSKDFIFLQSSQSGSEPPPAVSSTCTALETSTLSSAAPVVPISGEPTNCLDCDWSEHVCPDGYKYFYNCVTCESRVRFSFVKI